uniref:NADH-ubiquinone oxidoreductase chain 2 n=1 Tax=Ozobranchus jantseanus TaxID=1955321 RepID=A0A343D0M2_9ANNE|nr:NADH dehydrogenase subunit 2 [Ozobranchus jantseanus]ARR75361.1 NADH dehydrogenase subunit 2 [Ozobranchus jantseanus]
MLLTPVLMLCSFTLVTSTIMALSSMSWFTLWISLELNMLSFIPLIFSSNSNMELEASIKYFLVQAFASSMLLFASTCLVMKSFMPATLMNMMIILSLLTKLGSFPCHYWFPYVMQSVNWTTATILATWQKIAPIMALFFLINTHQVMLLIALMNVFIGGLLGMFTSSIRQIMAYSSIAHMGWMMSLMPYNMSIYSVVYLIMYIIMVLPVFYMFMKYNINSITDMKQYSNMKPLTSMSLSLMILSLAGLPPLSGFMPKLMILVILSQFNMMLAFIMVIMSAMSLYFYLNMTMNMVISPLYKMSKEKLHFKSIMSILISFMYLPLILLIYALT